MEKVYGLHKHSYLIVIYLQKTTACFAYYSTTTMKEFARYGELREENSRITYDKHKMGIKSWGNGHLQTNARKKKKDVCIDNFRDKLYQVFKKDKDKWDENDVFLLKAVSDFIQLFVEDLKEESRKKMNDTDQLHYICVVPSEWEEEIRETLLRPIFIQSSLLSKNDHNDRLFFCSDLESIFYRLMDKNDFDFEKIKKTILCRLVPVSEDEILIKSDLVSTVSYLFDFPDPLLYPKIERSHSLSLTIKTVTDGIRAFIKDTLPLSIQEEIVQIIIDKKYEDKEDYLKKPLITDTSKWKLDKHQLDFIRHICIFDICSQIRKNTTNSIDILLSNDIIKEYNFRLSLDLLSSRINPNKNLLNWSEYLLTYDRTYSRNKNIIYTDNSYGGEINLEDFMKGVCRYGQDAINNANIYCGPQIVPVRFSASSLSIFQIPKLDAIMNIDISMDSTILSFSLLDENGFVKEIWNHNDFLKDKSLCSLGHFFSFSETTTVLKMKHSFIEFAKDYLIDGISSSPGNKKTALLELKIANVETILSNNNCTEDIVVSTHQNIYIEAFVLLYMTYIKHIISSKLSGAIGLSTKMKIGFNISVKKILLNRLFGTKEGLKSIMYVTSLIQKDGNSKKLRITSEGERIMHLLRQSLTLPFPLNSYFVLAQLHENYIQLTLNKVVTESSPEDKDQEAIIIHDRIIHIPNIYTSLCLNMWNNIVEDSSLIKLCDRHQEYSSNDLLEIFSLKNQAEFTENLKQYISKDNLSNNSSQPATDEINIQLSKSCNCRVYLTTRDIIDISFRPVLQHIASLVSASFINKELFGNFWNIQYLFQLISFNSNTQLHDSLIKTLKETTEDIMIEQGVDIRHYVIPKSLNQPLQPILHQQPISYKEFKVGTLHHVYGDTYGFIFLPFGNKVSLVSKSKATDTNTVSLNKEKIFLLFKKGDIVNDLPTNRIFYLKPQEKTDKISILIKYFKIIFFDDILEGIYGPTFDELLNGFKKGHDIPFLISVLYEAYSGSFILRANIVGRDIGENEPIRIGTPMYLSRF